MTILSALSCGPCRVTCGVRDVRESVQVYLPLSDPVRGEKIRERPSVEILPSPELVTADPFTVHVTLTLTSTAGLRPV